MQLRGCGTALVTPFSQDGAVDENALRNLVAWQVESGIEFLIPCGTTGETPTLNHDEWLHDRASTPSSPLRLTTTSLRRKVNTGTFARSPRRSISPSSSITCRAAR